MTKKINKLDVYLLISIIHSDGISYHDMNNFLRKNGLENYIDEYEQHLKRSSDMNYSFSTKKNRFIYKNLFYPNYDYVLKNKGVLYNIITKLNLNKTFYKILSNYIKNNDNILMERQKHGFLYEQNKIREFDILKNGNYTDKWDGNILNINDKMYNLPISIKCIQKGGSVDFGDFFRQSDIDEDFILIIGFWEGKKDNIIEEYIIKINIDNWKSYFGNLSIKDNIKSDMNKISNDHKDDDNWKIFMDKYKKEYIINNNIMSLRFKRDHKKQKRIQCGISYNRFIENVLTDNEILLIKKTTN